MFTYYDFLQLCWNLDCWSCPYLVDDEERPIYCSNEGHRFCYRHLSDILFDYYFQTTGAVFVPLGGFLDELYGCE